MSMSSGSKKKTPSPTYGPLSQSSELRKSVEAVYAYPEKGKLTLLGRKAFNLLLANAMKQGIDCEWYSIDVYELANDIRYDSNDIKRLESVLTEMQRTILRWNILKEENDKTITVRNQVQLLGAVQIMGGYTDSDRRNAVARTVKYKFDSEVKKSLLAPEIYARINLQLQATIKSAFSLALYEQLIRYRNNIGGDGWAYTVKLPWQTWRNLLLGGEYNVAFEEYRYFNRDVIAKSLKELNQRITDFEFEVLVSKSKRTVTDIQFRIRESPQVSLPLISSEPLINTEQIQRRLEALSFSETEISKLLRANDLANLEDAAQDIEARLKRGDLNPIRNKAAYFLDSLRRLKKCQPTESNIENIESHNPLHRVAEQKNIRVVEEISTPRSAEEAGLSWQDVEPWLIELTADLRSEILDEYIRQEKNPAVISAYKKYGLKSPMVQVVFVPWVESNWLSEDLFPGKGILSSYEESPELQVGDG